MLAGGLAMTVSGGTPVWAQARQPQAAAAVERDGEESADAAMMDEEAKSLEGAQHVTQRLSQTFGVEASRITELRQEQLGYGEIHHLLSIAQRMPGG